jgi:hypothetical protein
VKINFHTIRENCLILCGNKMPTRCNRWVFTADLIACSTCFGYHYAHHQESESIIQVVSACRIRCLVFKLSVWCVVAGCVPGLRAAARKPDTQPAIKTHLLHLVGILFPHIIDDARSKPHQMSYFKLCKEAECKNVH